METGVADMNTDEANSFTIPATAWADFSAKIAKLNKRAAITK